MIEIDVKKNIKKKKKEKKDKDCVDKIIKKSQ